MVVKFIKERKKQKYLIIGLGAIIVFTCFILWYGYLREKEPAVSLPATVVTPLREIRINFEVLENPFLKKLQPFVEIPSFVGEKGRENPFLPY